MKKRITSPKRHNNHKRYAQQQQSSEAHNTKTLEGDTEKPAMSARAPNTPLSATNRTSSQKAIRNTELTYNHSLPYTCNTMVQINHTPKNSFKTIELNKKI